MRAADIDEVKVLEQCCRLLQIDFRPWSDVGLIVDNDFFSPSAFAIPNSCELKRIKEHGKAQRRRRKLFDTVTCRAGVALDVPRRSSAMFLRLANILTNCVLSVRQDVRPIKRRASSSLAPTS
jgi:hypothetical protein